MPKIKRKIIIADFVCPFKEGRKIFKPDYLIWMDTIKKEDTLPSIKHFKNQKNMILELKLRMQKKFKKNCRIYFKITLQF